MREESEPSASGSFFCFGFPVQDSQFRIPTDDELRTALQRGYGSTSLHEDELHSRLLIPRFSPADKL